MDGESCCSNALSFVGMGEALMMVLVSGGKMVTIASVTELVVLTYKFVCFF